ncbi:hypothetical protein ACFLYB_06070 [Chloroflexota bacterium]
MIFRRLFIVLIIVLPIIIALPACSSGTITPSDTLATDASDASFIQDIQPIFNLSCVICHQGATALGRLNLEEGLSYKNLVNVNSKQSPLKLVAPRDSDGSYLLNKLRGTQLQVGGVGVVMPYGTSPLQPSLINMIQQWIEQGAPDN